MSADRLRRWYGIGVVAGFLSGLIAPAYGQTLAYMPVDHFTSSFPQYGPPPSSPDDVATSDEQLPPQLRRQIVSYQTNEPSGTIIIDTAHTFLYLTLGNGQALRYGIGVGREGFTWSGVETITRKAEWPDWIPPKEMVARQPYLPRWVGGGPGNPLGARALYLGNTDYRIHGTNDPTTIGKHVSSGCIRLDNADIIDLYNRVGIGAKVVVLSNEQHSVTIGGERGRAVIGASAVVQARSTAFGSAASKPNTPSGIY